LANDFRTTRALLSDECFLLATDKQPDPTDIVEEDIWHGIMHLPDDVAIRTFDHNGVRLALLYSLWSDWITATGDPEKPDELFSCMLDAADAFQCTKFLLLHGYYRAAMLSFASHSNWL
jgi:hypothetical protein